MSGWKMIGFALLATLAASVAWLYIRPYFHTYPEQDECSFGPVSNERYRELLAEAKRKQASGEWPGLSDRSIHMHDNLQLRLDDLMDGMESIYERIAAMHALARAAGAELRGPSDTASFYTRWEEARKQLGFLYTLDAHKLGGFAPFQRYIMFSFMYYSKASSDLMYNDKFVANVQMPVIYTSWRHPFQSPPPNCPSIPDEQWLQEIQLMTNR
jgi:hypothetical protein